MRDMLEKQLARFEELERQMSDPEVLADSQRMANVAREHGSLATLANSGSRFTTSFAVSMAAWFVAACHSRETDAPRS